MLTQHPVQFFWSIHSRPQRHPLPRHLEHFDFLHPFFFFFFFLIFPKGACCRAISCVERRMAQETTLPPRRLASTNRDVAVLVNSTAPVTTVTSKVIRRGGVALIRPANVLLLQPDQPLVDKFRVLMDKPIILLRELLINPAPGLQHTTMLRPQLHYELGVPLLSISRLLRQ